MEETCDCGGHHAAGHCAVCGSAEPRPESAIQRSGSRRDRRTTGRQLPELHQLDRQRHRTGRGRRRGPGCRRVVADGTRLWAVVVRGWGSAGYLRSHAFDRVLDHKRNGRSDLTVRPRVKGRTSTGQPAKAMKQCGLPITRTLLPDVSPSLGNRTPCMPPTCFPWKCHGRGRPIPR